MKKVLLAAMLMLSASALFSSCSSSDDDNQEEQNQTSAEKVISGRWRMTKVADFPIPINNYSLKGDNYVTFADNGSLTHEGNFEVAINGNERNTMTLPFSTYTKWSAESSSDAKAIVVYLRNSKEQYVGYIMSSTRIDLVKFSDDKAHGISYTLEK